MNYVNEGLPFLVNCQITEYDMAKGNTSVMRHYHLIPEEDIRSIEQMPKEERVRAVGMLQRNNREFARALESSFNLAVKEFLKQNDLDIDVDVLCVRRDAVFVVNKGVQKPTIGEHIMFRPKHQYHAALQIGPKWHFFFEKDRPIKIDHFLQQTKDERGVLDKLREGIVDFLREFVELCESTNMNRNVIYEWLNQFCTFYKEKKLDLEYYREFTPDALFHLSTEDGDTYLEDVPEYLVEDLDISYNYRNIIVPLCQILI